MRGNGARPADSDSGNLANKCSIASRIDCFSGMGGGVGIWEGGEADYPSSFYNDGSIFRQQQFT